MTDIAMYLENQEYSLQDLFERFDTDVDKNLSQSEFYEMLKEIKINVTP